MRLFATPAPSRLAGARLAGALLAATFLLQPAVAEAGGKYKSWARQQNWNAKNRYYYAPLLRNLPAGRVVKSRIRRVEVYLGRALIERHARVTLTPGSQRLVIPALPWQIQASTLNIAGFGGDAVAGSTFLEEGTLVEARPKELRTLEAAKTRFDRRDQALRNQATILETEQMVLAKTLTSPSVPWTIGTIRKSLGFARSELKRITTQLTEIDTQRKALAPSLKRLREAHAKLLSKLQRKVRHVVIEVRAKRAMTLHLKVRYVVTGPTWKPRHEGRYNPATRKLHLDTFAWVVQKTGEPWNNVAIQVSNARPTTGLLPPSPRSRFVALGAAGARRAGVSYRFRELATYASGAASSSVRVFKPSGNVSVPSGPKGRRVRVASIQMAAHAQHISNPMEHPGAYLKLSVKNHSTKSLLAGGAALFNGADYVGTAILPSVQPAEELVIPFGRDPNVSVIRRRIQRTQNATRFRQSIQVQYRFKVVNHHPYAVSLQLQEVLPRATTGRVRIKMDRTTPAPKRGPKTLPRDTYVWSLNVQPGGTSTWTWGYSVTGPGGKRIVGVD